MSVDTESCQIGIWIDFENLIQGHPNAEYYNIDQEFTPILARIQEWRRKYLPNSAIVRKFAFANWSDPSFERFPNELSRFGVSIEKHLQAHRFVKNAADIALVAHVLQFAFLQKLAVQNNQKSESNCITHFLLVSGDAGFAPVIQTLKAYPLDFNVIAAGYCMHTSAQFASLCDHFIPLPEFRHSVFIQKCETSLKGLLNTSGKAFYEDALRALDELIDPKVDLSIEEMDGLLKKVLPLSPDHHEKGNGIVATGKRLARAVRLPLPRLPERLANEVRLKMRTKKFENMYCREAVDLARRAVNSLVETKWLQKTWVENGLSVNSVFEMICEITSSDGKSDGKEGVIDGTNCDETRDKVGKSGRLLNGNRYSCSQVVRAACCGTRVRLYRAEVVGDRSSRYVYDKEYGEDRLILGLRSQAPRKVPEKGMEWIACVDLDCLDEDDDDSSTKAQTRSLGKERVLLPGSNEEYTEEDDMLEDQSYLDEEEFEPADCGGSMMPLEYSESDDELLNGNELKGDLGIDMEEISSASEAVVLQNLGDFTLETEVEEYSETDDGLANERRSENDLDIHLEELSQAINISEAPTSPSHERHSQDLLGDRPAVENELISTDSFGFENASDVSGVDSMISYVSGANPLESVDVARAARVSFELDSDEESNDSISYSSDHTDSCDSEYSLSDLPF